MFCILYALASNPLFRSNRNEKKKRADKIDKGLIALKSGIVLLIIAQQHAKSFVLSHQKMENLDELQRIIPYKLHAED